MTIDRRRDIACALLVVVSLWLLSSLAISRGRWSEVRPIDLVAGAHLFVVAWFALSGLVRKPVSTGPRVEITFSQVLDHLRQDPQAYAVRGELPNGRRGFAFVRGGLLHVCPQQVTEAELLALPRERLVEVRAIVA
jgi:hypothetical protein